MNWPLFWAYIIVGTFIFVLFSITPVWAHDWYDRECCSDKDCHPIDSCDEITENSDGSASYQGMTFRRDKVKPSHDSKCHVCIYHGGAISSGQYSVPMCIYIQQGS